ncbi:MAG TPA: hypothetical protein VM582_02420, partial [Candidatus Thermoplasmatota archaeon]|nr:hypothetical protein [Candidatus Thermoplasmatota archaeon]
TYTIETNVLEQACAYARREMVDRVLGRFDIALATTGGRVRAVDDDGDGRAERLVSEDGYGGTLHVPAVPNAVSPVLLIDFGATRRP